MAKKFTLMAAIHQHDSGTDGNLFLFSHDLGKPELPSDEQKIADLLTINYDPFLNESLILSDFNNVGDSMVAAFIAVGIPIIKQSQL